MFKETLRIFAVLLLIIVALMDDFPVYNKMKDPTSQLVFAFVVVSCVYYDTTFGFILGLVLMLVYYEIYRKIKITINEVKNQDPMDLKVEKINSEQRSIPIESKPTNNVVKLDYISKEHLIAAQNNVFDTNNYTSEVKGIERGFNNESVYGAQGLDFDRLNFVGYSREEYASF